MVVCYDFEEKGIEENCDRTREGGLISVNEILLIEIVNCDYVCR